MGGERWFGYSLETAHLANVEDGLRLLTHAAAQRRARLSRNEMAPRPGGMKRRKIKSNNISAMMGIAARMG